MGGTVTEQRDVVVAGAMQRHQLREWLKGAGIEYRLAPDSPEPWEHVFRITANAEQWQQINEWLQRIEAK